MAEVTEAKLVEFLDVVDADGSAHTEYFIQVTCAGGFSWEVSRRYSAFLALFECLRPSMPVLGAFRFPRKSMVSTFADHTKQRRLSGFQEFLDLVMRVQPRPMELLEFLDYFMNMVSDAPDAASHLVMAESPRAPADRPGEASPTGMSPPATSVNGTAAARRPAASLQQSPRDMPADQVVATILRKIIVGCLLVCMACLLFYQQLSPSGLGLTDILGAYNSSSVRDTHAKVGPGQLPGSLGGASSSDLGGQDSTSAMDGHVGSMSGASRAGQEGLATEPVEEADIDGQAADSRSASSGLERSGEAAGEVEPFASRADLVTVTSADPPRSAGAGPEL